jgi:ABC-type Na+ efflux pump permease subunit
MAYVAIIIGIVVAGCVVGGFGGLFFTLIGLVGGGFISFNVTNRGGLIILGAPLGALAGVAMSKVFDDGTQEIPAAVVPQNYLINPKLLVVLVVLVIFCAFCIWANKMHDQREASKHSRIQVCSALMCSHRSSHDRVFSSFFISPGSTGRCRGETEGRESAGRRCKKKGARNCFYFVAVK